MVQSGANVDKWDVRGRSPLYMAVDMNTVPESFRYDLPSTDSTRGADVVSMLLEAGANPNLQLKRKPPYRERVMDRGGDMILHVGATPLLRAAKAADVEVVKLLLAHGALVDLPNAYGVTPFLAAAGYGNNDRSTRGLHRSEEATLETMRILMAAGADIHARSLGEPKGVPRPSRYYDAVMGQRGRHMYSDRQVPSEIAVPHRNAAHAAAMRGLDFVLVFLAENGVALTLEDAEGHTPLDLAKGNYEPEHRLNKPNPLPQTIALLERLTAAGATSARVSD
jgi:ankyrin repeat protein